MKINPLSFTALLMKMSLHDSVSQQHLPWQHALSWPQEMLTVNTRRQHPTPLKQMFKSFKPSSSHPQHKHRIPYKHTRTKNHSCQCQETQKCTHTTPSSSVTVVHGNAHSLPLRVLLLLLHLRIGGHFYSHNVIHHLV